MRWVFLIVALLWVAPAAAEPTFTQFVDSSKEKKGAFLVGVIGTMSIYYELAGKVDDLKYCFNKLKLSNGDLIESAEKYVAKERADWKDVEAAQVLVSYINVRCGLAKP